MNAAWPLVGRDAQVGRLRDLLRDGRAGGVIISGPAGIGKSRLLAEARTLGKREHLHVVRAEATAATHGIPFGAFAHLLPRPTGGGHDRLDVLLDLADRICAEAGRRRLVLVVDDAHLTDDASVALIHHLAGVRRALLLVAFREGENLPDALHRLWRDGLLEWWELSPLDHDVVADLLGRVLGGPVAGRTAARLAGASQGNPLYLRELVRGAQSQGLFDRVGGVWSLSELPGLSAPLADVLRRRLQSLTPDLREVVELVRDSEPVELALLRQVVDERLLETAEAQGLLALHTSGRREYLRLAHPLFGQLVRGQPGQLRLLRLRRELLGALVGTGLRRHGDGLRLALAQVDGVVPPDPRVLLAATAAAAAVFDHDLVVRLGTAAEQAGAGFEAGAAVAEAYAWRGDHEEAERALAQLEAVAGADEERGIAARNRAGNLFFGLGRTRAANEVIAAASARITDPHWLGELGLLRAGIAVCSGHAAEALELGAIALGVAGTERLQLHQMPGLVSTFTALGDTGAAISAGVEAVTPLERAADDYPYLIATTKVSLSEAYVMHGALDEAQALVSAGYAEAVHACADGLRGQWALAAGRVALARGEVATAGRYFAEAALLLGRHGSLLGPPGRLEALGGLATAAVLQGDRAAAVQAVADADAIFCEDAFVTALELARAWIAAAATGSGPDRGPAAAAGLALAIADRARDLGGDGYEAVALHTAARLHPRVDGPAERLHALAEKHPAPMHRAYADHARALAAADAPALDASAEAFAGLGATLLAAEAAAAAAAAYAARPATARNPAAAADSEGFPAAAAAALRAHAWLERCEGVRSPALDGSALRSLPELTRREHETASLAAAGLSNAAIAERLVLSVRTVESHLHSAYAKLGVTSREALSPLFASGRTTQARDLG